MSLSKSFLKEMRILGIILVTSVIVLYCFADNSLGKHSKKQNPEDTVKIFIKNAQKGDIVKIEVFYYCWTMRTASSISEIELKKTGYDFKTVLQKPRETHLQEVIQSLGSFAFIEEKAGNYPHDHRLGFTAYNKNGEILNISFVYNVPIVKINGVYYRTEVELLRSVMEFLPYMAHKEIRNAFLMYYMSLPKTSVEQK